MEKNWNKKIITFIFVGLVVTVLITIFSIQNIKSENIEIEAGPQGISSQQGLVYYPPNLGMYEKYLEDAIEYKSKLGFSFKYPKYLFIETQFEPYELYVWQNTVFKNGIENSEGIKIVIHTNDKRLSPLEWLDSKEAEANLPKEGYVNILNVDGQQAVAIEGGSWVIVNTPDNKYILSLSLLPSNNENFLYTEMGIIIDSLRFSR